MLRYKIITAPARVREAALREWRDAAAALRMAQIRCARATRMLEATDAHRGEGSASISEFAERNGVSGYEARMLSGLGRAIESEPAIVPDVAAGAIPVASAAVLGDLTKNPALKKSGDDWVGWAKTHPTAFLRRLYWMRRDELQQGVALVDWLAHVKPKVRDDLARAADLASRSANASLTRGQMLEILVKEYLDLHDPLRTTPGTRRVGDTNAIPDSRYVPEEVDRGLRQRAGDGCTVPFCGRRRFLHRSHRVPHAEGSGRELNDLDLVCDWHHFLYEIGEIVPTGPPEKPEWRDRQGRLLSERRLHPPREPLPPGTPSVYDAPEGESKNGEARGDSESDSAAGPAGPAPPQPPWAA